MADMAWKVLAIHGSQRVNFYQGVKGRTFSALANATAFAIDLIPILSSAAGRWRSCPVVPMAASFPAKIVLRDRRSAAQPGLPHTDRSIAAAPPTGGLREHTTFQTAHRSR